MLRRVFSPLHLSLLLLILASPSTNAQTSSAGQNSLLAERKDRITQYIDDERRVVLQGHRHPLATPDREAGVPAPGYRLERMILTLRPSSSQQSALDELLAAQRDPESPSYHQWLTPESYGERFGVSESDLAQVVNWLQWHGMSVEEVTAGRRSIIFSGTAAQVEAAFHTPIHTYQVAGELHYANANDPEIPQALAQVVGGVVSLHDFRSQPMHALLGRPAPLFSAGNTHNLTPADFATIYHIAPLYQQGLNGSGQTIAVVGRTNINVADVRQFRSSFGLPANDPQVIVTGANPGIVSVGEEVEADLDVQWAGALASNAAVKFVVSASTGASDGVYLSAQYIVNHNLAPVMTMSFGLCEAALGSSGNAFINSLWQQAAAQGITVFVSSGDSGAAGCDSSSATTASAGRGVNGLCSSPYSVCVGGTQFNDVANPGAYWSSSNASGTQASALSYIPEVVWNESGSSGLWASGGGASTVYAKPSWQAGPGVPADGKRDVPDVSLTAAGHDGYLIYLNGGMGVVGGTSAATPSLASIMALVLQAAGTRAGNANPTFYTLASRQALSGGAAVFHDVTSGTNNVPGVSGYSATGGYDLATGLGSIDAYLLVNHWSEGNAVPAFQLSASSSSVSFAPGASGTVNLTVSVSGGFNSPVSLSVSGLPSGVTSTLTPAKFSAPGSGTSVLKLTAAASARPGSYTITVTATGGGITKTASSTLTLLAPPNFTLAASSSSVAVPAGNRGSVTLTTAANTTFNAAVSLSVSALPAGMTASFAPSRIPSPGSGTSTLTFSAASGVAAGAYTVSITATGGGITQTARITVNVPGFTISASTSTVSLRPGGKATVTVTAQAVAGFKAALALSVSGVPKGVTASLSTQTIAAPGNGASTLSLTRTSAATVGASKLTLTAVGGGVTKTVTVTLNVTSN
jgi:subtilase family serine protease